MDTERLTEHWITDRPPNRWDGGVPPRYALARSGDDLYFVNHSDEILDWVANGSIGCITAGDETACTSAFEIRYDKVLPGEAVKIDEFDTFFDPDMLIQTDIAVMSPSLGATNFRLFDKGGPKSKVLLWMDGQEGRYVSMSRRPPGFQ